jgi:epoxyqueuosine reductase
MDKAWAKKGGLGWIGKNSNLIHPKKGSFFFIAELILDIELEEDGPIKDFCGTCTRCIDACPTDAIVEPYVVDGSKCISYLTIELKDEVLPTEFTGKMNDWVFGCDVCQDVCPWNRFSTPHTEPLFQPHDDLLYLSKKDWNELSDEYFQQLFKKSAVKRTKKSGLTRNITFAQKDKK